MNILDTFFTQIEWDTPECNDGDSKIFFKDVSKETKRKHSYAFQMMDDCLTLEPRYTVRDLQAEESFLNSLKEKSANTTATSSNSFESFREVPKVLRPGEILTYINYPKVSSFSWVDLKRYKDLLFRSKLNQLSPTEFQEFQELDERLKNERKEYQEFAKTQWLKQNYLRHGNILPDVKKYIDEIWQARLHRLNDYPEWYKQIGMVPLVYNTGADNKSNDINMVPGRILYKLGQPGRYVNIPRNRCIHLCYSYDDLVQGQPIDSSSKYPAVSRDPVAEEMVLGSEAQVVISSSGLKCLLDNQCTNLTAVWTLPICVREYKKEKATKRVVFIDKKLPPRTMTLSQRFHWYTKIATRMLYCQNNDVAFNESEKNEPNGDLNSLKNSCPRESSDKLNSPGNEMEVENSSGVIYDLDSHASDQSDNEGLVIDVDYDETNQPVKQRNVVKISNATVQPSNVCNPSIQNIINDSNKPGIINETSNLKSQDRGNSGSHQNIPGNDAKSKNCYVYQMWKLGKHSINQLMKSEGENISVIIRSRHDCINENRKAKRIKQLKNHIESNKMDVDNNDDSDNSDFMTVVQLVPKLEYQFDYGAERTTPSECIRQWADTVIRPGAQIYRVRINPLTAEVIQMERSDHLKMRSDGISKNINLSKTWCSLYSVLSKLVTLAPGNYLLEHSPKHGAFCALSVATGKPGAGTSNLYSTYRISVEDVAPIQAPWIPLDESIFTPMCHYKSVLPLMFPSNKSVQKKQPKTIIGEITKKTGKSKGKPKGNNPIVNNQLRNSPQVSKPQGSNKQRNNPQGNNRLVAIGSNKQKKKNRKKKRKTNNGNTKNVPNTDIVCL